MIIRSVILATGLALGACRPDAERAAVSHDTLGRGDSPRIVLQLVDTLRYVTELDEGFLHRVEVRRGAHIDTIPGVLTLLEPVAEGDSLVYGFLFDSAGTLREGFRFSIPRRRVDPVPLPTDLLPSVSYPALAADARHVAYARFDTDGTARGIIRRWPSLEPVLETPSIGFVAGDMLGGAAEWEDAQSFTIYIDPFSDGSNRWARLRGRLGSTNVAVDTVPLGGHSGADER